MYSSPTCVNLPRHVNFRERERGEEEKEEEEDASQRKKLNGKEGSGKMGRKRKCKLEGSQQ